MKLLIVPIYSMRSHKTGKYQLLLDSNMNIALHKCSVLSYLVDVTITIPTNVDSSQLNACIGIASKMACSITFMPIHYGSNAGETRNILNDGIKNGPINQRDFDKVILGVCTVDPVIENTEYHLYNTPILGKPRPYVDEHMPTILNRLENGYRVNFSCENQLYKVPTQYLHLCTTDMKLYSKDFMAELAKEFVDQDLFIELDTLIPIGAVFFPFRISDPVYKWDAVRSLNSDIVVTDPNESLRDTNGILQIGNMHKCKKTLYMTMLALMKQRDDITIELYEDIYNNYHISIVEMMDMVPENMRPFVDISTVKFIARYIR